jgi:hypothetical protein
MPPGSIIGPSQVSCKPHGQVLSFFGFFAGFSDISKKLFVIVFPYWKKQVAAAKKPPPLMFIADNQITFSWYKRLRPTP